MWKNAWRAQSAGHRRKMEVLNRSSCRANFERAVGHWGQECLEVSSDFMV